MTSRRRYAANVTHAAPKTLVAWNNESKSGYRERRGDPVCSCNMGCLFSVHYADVMYLGPTLKDVGGQEDRYNTSRRPELLVGHNPEDVVDRKGDTNCTADEYDVHVDESVRVNAILVFVPGYLESHRTPHREERCECYRYEQEAKLISEGINANLTFTCGFFQEIPVSIKR